MPYGAKATHSGSLPSFPSLEVHVGRTRTSTLVAVALLGAVAASLFLAVPSAAAATDWIAFTRDPTGGSAYESGDEEIYAMRLDGSGLVRLTANACIDITPAASADGRWLAWVQKCGTAVDLLIAPIVYDTTGQLGIGGVTNLTASLGSGADRWPQFSPDGTRLAFIRKTTGNFDIWMGAFTVSATGVPSLASPYRVVRLGGSTVEDCCVTWSPDGASLVWASNVNQKQQSFNLYRIGSDAREVWDATTNVDRSADGTLDVTVVTQLTFGTAYEGTPAYDADGTVLFRCNCPNPDVTRLDPVTRATTRLTTYLGLDRTPEGYPGGILYSRDDGRSGSDEIYVAAPDGSNPVNVTRFAWSDVNPTWIPPQTTPPSPTPSPSSSPSPSPTPSPSPLPSPTPSETATPSPTG
jgi:Tol biopolymer transport system component